MSIEDKVKEAEEKLKTYQDALTLEIAKLRQVRTNIATEAKRRLSDLEGRIPLLEKEISEKTKKVQDLDVKIKNKEVDFERERQYWKSHYEDLIKKNNEEYAKNIKNLDKLEDSVKEREKEALSIKEDFLAKSSFFDKKEENIKARESSLKYGFDKLLHDRKEFDGFVAVKIKELEGYKKKLESKEEALDRYIYEFNRKSSILDEREKDLESRESQAAEIIAKKSSLESYEKSLDNKSEEINKLSVEIRADRIKENERTRKLNALEQDLNQRLERVKLLEATV